MKDMNEQSRELLQPIVDLFSAADGGPAFSRLRHSFLPDMLEKRGDPNVDEFLLMVERMSRLCKLMMGEEL